MFLSTELLSKFSDKTNMDSSYSFSFGDLFRCACCPQKQENPQDPVIRAIFERLDKMESRNNTADTAPQTPVTVDVVGGGDTAKPGDSVVALIL